MMHESKDQQRIGKAPSLHFFTVQLVHKSYLVAIW